MSYLIRAVGIDLAPRSSGVSLIGMRAGTWETSVLDAGVVHLSTNACMRQTQFSQHLAAANKFTEFVRRCKPDLVGVEDYTNQPHSYVGFSMGQLGGIVRLMLWQEGFRQLLITPGRLGKIIFPESAAKRPTGKKAKQASIDWVKNTLGAEFTGKGKEPEDMAEATIYALIAACFFSAYWLHQMPPLTARQREILHSKIPHPSSALAKRGWIPTGLMDRPYHYLIRNPAKEAVTYTPEWMRSSPNDVYFVGEGTSELC